MVGRSIGPRSGSDSIRARRSRHLVGHGERTMVMGGGDSDANDDKPMVDRVDPVTGRLLKEGEELVEPAPEKVVIKRRRTAIDQRAYDEACRRIEAGERLIVLFENDDGRDLPPAA